MVVLGLSEEAKQVVNDALQLAIKRQDAELDSIHLLYALLKSRIFNKTWQMSIDDQELEAILINLQKQLNKSHQATSEIPEPSERYLHVLNTAEQVAQTNDMDYVMPEHLLSAILKYDSQIFDNLTIKLPVPTAQIKGNVTPTLDQLGRDLTLLAQRGALTPVIGREKEIQQLIEVLLSRGKNSALLIGPAGTGKTAIAEGLAQHIVGGKVPSKLRGTRLFELNLSSLVAGTIYRGEFEERLQSVIKTLVVIVK